MVSKVIGSRAQVWHGTAKKTRGGLTKRDLKKNRKSGRIMSRKKSEKVRKGKRNNTLKKWNKCVKQARKEIGAKGFVPVGGKSKEGKALLKATRACYN